jgi:DNA-binding MarR family transcriptional regulator
MYEEAVDQPPDQPAKRWLDERESRAWEGLQFMNMQLQAALARELAADSNLSIQDYAVLVALTAEADERMRAFELARRLGWDKTRLSHHLNRMVARGLVVRETCPSDRRGQFLVLTPDGRTAIEEAAPGHVAAVRRMFIDHLTDDEIDALGDLTNRIIEVLSACPGDPPEHDSAASEELAPAGHEPVNRTPL